VQNPDAHPHQPSRKKHGGKKFFGAKNHKGAKLVWFLAEGGLGKEIEIKPGPRFLPHNCLPRAQKSYRFAALKNVEEKAQDLAARPLEPGILGNNSPCFIARRRKQRPMGRKIGQAESGQAGLFRAEHVALAAQPQVFLGNAKAVVRLAHDRNPRLGGLAERRAVKQQARGFVRPAPDSAAQLMQLR
jgi:hypothetical protein